MLLRYDLYSKIWYIKMGLLVTYGNDDMVITAEFLETYRCLRAIDTFYAILIPNDRYEPICFLYKVGQ